MTFTECHGGDLIEYLAIQYIAVNACDSGHLLPLRDHYIDLRRLRPSRYNELTTSDKKLSRTSIK